MDLKWLFTTSSRKDLLMSQNASLAAVKSLHEQIRMIFRIPLLQILNWFDSDSHSFFFFIFFFTVPGSCFGLHGFNIFLENNLPPKYHVKVLTQGFPSIFPQMVVLRVKIRSYVREHNTSFKTMFTEKALTDFLSVISQYNCPWRPLNVIES